MRSVPALLKLPQITARFCNASPSPDPLSPDSAADLATSSLSGRHREQNDPTKGHFGNLYAITKSR
jgi:hypothetical protein